MKNGEGTGSAKLAKEDAEGEDRTLLGILMKVFYLEDRNLLKKTSSNA